MSEKLISQLLEQIRSLLQTHTVAVSQIMDIQKQVVVNDKKHAVQDQMNKQLIDRLEDLKKSDEKQINFQQQIVEKVNKNSVISTLVQAVITAVTIAIILKPWE